MILPAGCRLLAANFRAGGIVFKGVVKEDAADVGAGHVVSSRFETVGSSAMERMGSAAWGTGMEREGCECGVGMRRAASGNPTCEWG